MKATPLILAASMLAVGTLLSACAAETAKTENMRPKGPEPRMLAAALPATTPQTGWTTGVPDEYLMPAAHPGTVERLDCATKDYAGNGSDIQKTAYVYLPYGYDAADAGTRCDIVYLMHGWGGSAGTRMAATLGNADELAYYTGRTDIRQAAAVVMQYTGHTEVSRADAPTYACCGTSDGIANWRTMENRRNTLTSRFGIPTEFHTYSGLPHGFGLGTGTAAESWINDAVAFWEANQ